MKAPTPVPPPFEGLSERKEGARYFEGEYRVRTGDVDQEMRVRLDAVARYLQDVANDNIEVTEFRDTDPFWIVRRTIIDVIRPISWPAGFTAQRWCGALSTRWTNMRVRLQADHETNRFNPDQREPGLIETEAFWINVNEQGMPSRLTDDAFEMLSAMTDEHRLRWKSMNPDKAPAADDIELPDRPHVLRITDFDPFKHLNNAAYLEAVEDELVDHPDLVDVPHRAVIEYLRPIVPGTPLTLRRVREADRLLIWMLIPDDAGELQVAATVSVSKLPVTA
ncbi:MULTISPECIES: acyl-[acyl-carrier-protein] thioesterase [unclassified Gordonia (in: high G+C Gram-positive bacteria)]|uniref:acyl-[acyl-carrier-protein] thioesterase n=1 Tax=unclassified Gordonia (in: high G+C Gram-positive bacteria) TaxID=2657482 RepID=UPI001F0E212B|nr:acyl-ACP thioesterase domain-containing protein [Gordonia sp. ABSL49_1]MCH5644613.1 thioesterase [Gordonia sp. ABSL49_1]